MATIDKRQINGKPSYRARVRVRGYPVQTASFSRMDEARRWAQETELNLKSGKHFPQDQKLQQRTVGEAIDRYIALVLPTKEKMQRSQTFQLLWWKNEIGDYYLENLTPAAISAGRDKLAQGKTPQGKIRSPSTVNRYIAAISHVFTVVVKDWCWLGHNPITKLRKLKEPRGRVRFLSDDERNRLLTVCQNSENKVLYPAVILCLTTGARKMEIMSLRWENIDLKRRWAFLDTTKNDERRVLALSNVAFNVLCEYAGDHLKKSGLIFPSYSDPEKPMHIRKAWKNAMKAAELKDFRFHDLRHSAASYLAMNGASLNEIADILGHKTLAMTMRYAHLSVSHKAQVIESMNNKILGHLDKTKGS